MPKANETGDKPVKKVTAEAKAKPEKADKIKSAAVEKATKTVKASAKSADKPVAAKTTAKTTAKAPAKAPAKKGSAPKQIASDAKNARVPVLADEQRRYYVEVAAYYIAERRGFSGGQLEDWVQAETEIDQLLREGILKP